MTSIGIPLLWMGEEFGEYKPKAIEQSKLDWTLLDDREDKSNEENKALFEYWCLMIKLRNDYKHILKTLNLDFIYEDSKLKLFVYHRYDDNKSDQMIIVINWSKQTYYDYNVPNVPAGKWIEWQTKQEYIIGKNTVFLTITTEPYQGKVFLCNK
ncbi:unnamed protein product [Didymodactylos carnosus]|nr:unnamed protein product [Didymodactylos carnosus]CAF3682178.1 unnamed protein product [Didymodactylos carnosus]